MVGDPAGDGGREGGGVWSPRPTGDEGTARRVVVPYGGKKLWIIFPGGALQSGLSCPSGAIHLLYGGKNPSHGAKCEQGPTPWGFGPVCAKAECSAIEAPILWMGASGFSR